MNSVFEAGKRLLRGSYSQYTPTGKSYFVKSDAYHKEPRLGDIVYYYSNGLKRVAHVGGVVSVSKVNDIYNIEVVEGNTSSGSKFNRNGGCVAKKKYSFKLSEVGGENRINGFGTPNFADDTCTIDCFIEVLNAEVGYIEKASKDKLNDKQSNIGDKNYTQYGEFFEKNKLGANGLYWCQQFISWCAFRACELYAEMTWTGWRKEWGEYCYFVNGKRLKDTWKYINNHWYVFDGGGEMIRGWFKQKEDWYYLNPDNGAMCASQWFKVGEKWYYVTKSGVMAKNVYIKYKDSYAWVNEQGEWIKEYDTKEPDLLRYGLAE